MEKNQVFFESYSMMEGQCYEKLFTTEKETDILKMKEEDFHVYFQGDMEKWNITPLADLEGLSPVQYLQTFETPEDLLALFRQGALLCDKDLPAILADKLKAMGKESTAALLQMSLDTDLIRDEVNFYIPLMAARLLGRWGTDEAVPLWIPLLHSLSEEQEILVEEYIAAMEGIGAPALEPLLSDLECWEAIGYIEEYLLSALVKIGKAHPSDRIFKALKESFQTMEDKVLGAMCLGDYGDGRAVPFLRGFMEKNKGKIDKATYTEVKAAIKRLGGTIGDL